MTRAAIVGLIAATTTKKGLKVHACFDASEYPAKIKVTDAQIAQVPLLRHAFHGGWNYHSILPTNREDEYVVQ